VVYALLGAVTSLGALCLTLLVKTFEAGRKIGAMEKQLEHCEKESERQDAETHALRVTVHKTANDVQGLLSKDELRMELERHKQR
jgi:hypothetical protein